MSNNSNIAFRPAPGLQSHPDRIEMAIATARFSSIQSQVLESLVLGSSVNEMLAGIAARIERECQSVACRIFVMSQDGSSSLHRCEPSSWTGLDKSPDAAGDPVIACALSGQSEDINDFQCHSRWTQHAAVAMLRGARSCRIEPFVAADDEAGAIAIYHAGPGEAHGAPAEFMKSIGDLVALAVRICRQHEKTATDAARFQSLSKSIPGVVYQRLVTPDGDIRYTYISESAEELFGVAAERIVNDPEALFQHYDDDYRENFRKRLIEASHAMQTWDVEAKIRRPDGQVAIPTQSPDQTNFRTDRFYGPALFSTRTESRRRNLRRRWPKPERASPLSRICRRAWRSSIKMIVLSSPISIFANFIPRSPP